MRNPSEMSIAEYQIMLQQLYDATFRFVKDNEIGCDEDIYQVDAVIVNAYDFISELCEIVGYAEDAK